VMLQLRYAKFNLAHCVITEAFEHSICSGKDWRLCLFHDSAFDSAFCPAQFWR
jgi:hypothetical protein